MGSNIAVGTISFFSGNGAVSSVTLTNPGSGYTTIPKVSIQKPANVSVLLASGTANVVAFDNITNTITIDPGLNIPAGVNLIVNGMPLTTKVISSDEANANIILDTTNIGTVSGTAIFAVRDGTQVYVKDAEGIFLGQSIEHPSVPFGATVTAIVGRTITVDRGVSGNLIGTSTFYDPGTGAEIIADIENISRTLQTATSATYTLKLSGNVSANIGDIITQSSSGANATVYGVNTSANTSILTISYNSAEQFANATIVLQMSGNVTANVGDYITQPIDRLGNEANLIVTVSASGNANVTAKYVDVYPLITTRFANIKLNGNWLSGNVYPAAVFEANTGITNIAKNSAITAVYPLATKRTGYINGLDINGNITLPAGTMSVSSVSWYNVGANTATDGTGFEGAVTEQVLFLKDAEATDISEDTVPGNEFLTEDAVNTLITETGNVTIIGD